MTRLIWGSSFKKAYRKTIKNNPHLKERFQKVIKTFEKDPFHPSLKTHKLSGKLKGLWAFVVEYNCRVVFQFLEEGDVLLIDIGKHDEVY